MLLQFLLGYNACGCIVAVITLDRIISDCVNHQSGLLHTSCRAVTSLSMWFSKQPSHSKLEREYASLGGEGMDDIRCCFLRSGG